MQPLSPAQKETLEFIVKHQFQEGRSPTHREIQLHFGGCSPCLALNRIEHLENKGYLRRIPGKARALIPTTVPTYQELYELAIARIDSIDDTELAERLRNLKGILGGAETPEPAHAEI